MQQPTSRKCNNCGMTRIPERELVTKDNKQWLIYTCRICRAKDIEDYETKPKTNRQEGRLHNW